MTSAPGIILVDKPAGPTSHDAVSTLRRALRIRQVGHTGTLDPFATGLLVMCVGSATRLAEYLVGLPKTYRGTLVLGTATDTDDRTGTVVRSSNAWRELDPVGVAAALAQQVGTIQQLPPFYSAKRVAGEKMYAAAREGRAPDRTPVAVTVHRIDVLRIDLPEVEIELECSKGTYVRAIARDVGDALGVGGHLAELRRTRVGAFRVEAAVPLDQLSDAAAVQRATLEPAAAVSHLPRVDLNDAETTLVRHGGRVPTGLALAQGEPVALFMPDGGLLAIGEALDGTIQPRKVLV